MFQIFVLGRISMKSFRSQPSTHREVNYPNVNPDLNCSNIYGYPERVLLAWLNFHYDKERKHLWKDSSKGGIPPARWIVNFDLDLLDGLVIAAVLGSFCPFLIETHLKDMYTCPNTAEQCLHNALTITNCFKVIGLDYDIQAGFPRTWKKHCFDLCYKNRDSVKKKGVYNTMNKNIEVEI